MSRPQIKNKQLQVRVPADFDEKLSAVAASRGQTPSGLARILLEQFVEAFETHGDRLLWKPRFAYYAGEVINESLPSGSTEYVIPKKKNHAMAAEGRRLNTHPR